MNTQNRNFFSPRLVLLAAAGGALLLGLGSLMLLPHGTPAAVPSAPTVLATAGILLPTVTAVVTAPVAAERPGSTPAAPELKAPPAGPALARPIRYAAIGASDTVGVGTTDPARENWTARVRAQLPPDTQYARFARSGITLQEAASVEIPEAIAYKPTLVTMWLTVNDVLRGVPLPVYQKALATALDRLTKETDAQIALLNVPDVEFMLPPTASPQTRLQMRSVTQAWNRALADTVRPYKGRVLIVDLFDASQQAPVHADWISADGFHPSPKGYAEIANLTVAALRQRGLVP